MSHVTFGAAFAANQQKLKFVSVESSVQSLTPAEPPGTPAASPGENLVSFLYALL